jgi:hypothetical protein
MLTVKFVKLLFNVCKSIIYFLSSHIYQYISFSFATAYYLSICGILCGLTISIIDINKTINEISHLYRYTCFTYQMKMIVQRILLDIFFNVLFFGCIVFIIGLSLPSIFLFFICKNIYINWS